MRLLDTCPALAGLLLGSLAYKPQLFCMVPVALAAKGAWRALGFTCASAVLLVLLSAAEFGPQAWWLWLDQVARGGDPAEAQWYGQTFLTGYSLYVCAILAGMAPLAAMLLQGAASLAAAAAAWWSHRRPCAEDARLAVLLIATVIATPHLQAYDMLLLGAASILLFVKSREGIGIFDLALFAGAWALPLLRPSLIPTAVYVIPVILTELLIEGVRRTNTLDTPRSRVPDHSEHSEGCLVPAESVRPLVATVTATD